MWDRSGSAPIPSEEQRLLRGWCETSLVSPCGERKLFPAPRRDSTLAPSGFNFRLGRRRDDKAELTAHLPQVSLE